jgi:glycosyltransferase involved in cell wall biosynthesis
LKICGFTIVRNAIQYDYPVVESILSVLPLVDEMLVSVGNSTDQTLEIIQNINSPKIRIMESIWDDSLRTGGKVLAEETNKAFAAIPDDFDWCFYLQADEILHEEDIPKLLLMMKQHLKETRVQGLLFSYQHFYGSYNYLGDSRKWYRNEIRIIRNDKRISSYRDAQGFRFLGKKLQVIQSGARIFHYGWVKNPRFQQAKQQQFNRLWHSDDWVKEHVHEADEFDYSQIDSLRIFEGSHPAAMKSRIENCDWHFIFDVKRKKFSLKNKLLYLMEKLTGWRMFEYRNFKLLR